MEPQAEGARADAPRGKGAPFWLSLGLIVVGAVYVLVFESDALSWAFSHGSLAPIAITVGLPACAYLIWRPPGERHELIRLWSIALFVFLVFAANRATIDAHTLRYENCWKIRGTSSGGIFECAPGKSQPPGWRPSENDNGRYCEQISTSSSGGSIWRCQTY